MLSISSSPPFSPSILKNHLAGDILHLIISLIYRAFFYHPIALETAIYIVKGTFGKIMPTKSIYTYIMKVLALLLLLQWMDMEGARAMQGKQTNSVTVAGVEREGFF